MGWRDFGHWTGLLVAVALYVWAHLYLGGQLAMQTNHDAAKSDQANNMKCARVAAERADMRLEKGLTGNINGWLPHYTDGVVNPLWPRLAAEFSERADDAAFFEAGKRWNVGFTAVFLGLMALALGTRWSLSGVLLFLLASGLGAFLPRAAWFQPEPVYFGLFLLSWIAGLALLRKNPLWLYAAFGVLTGLAYLAKASVQPLMLVFIGVSGLRFLASICPRFKVRDGPESRSDWKSSNHFIGMAVFACLHLVVIAPRLTCAQQEFGSPTFSYPSYWMWLDDFEAGYAWMGQYNSRAKLEALPVAERPSLKNYLAKHDKMTAWHRLVDGTWWQVQRLVASDVTPRDKHGKPRKPWKAILERPGWTLVGLAGLAGLAAAFAIGLRRKEKLPVHQQEPERGMLVLYVLGSVAFYSMLHGWYTPVGDGDRFMLALFAPVVFSLVAAAESIMRRLQARQVVPIIPLTFRCGQWILVVFLAWRLLELCRLPDFA